MEEHRRWTFTGLHDVHLVAAARLDMSATYRQRLQDLVLGLQDRGGVHAASHVSRPGGPSRSHDEHLERRPGAPTSSIIELPGGPVWLTRRIDDAHLPERRTVLELTTRHAREHRGWLVIERGREPYGCFEDPLLDETRYVYVAAAITVLLALAHGTCSWARALSDGSVVASGDPDLLEQLPTWFL